MLNFLSKIYQSLIAHDQLVKLFVERINIDFKTHTAVSGYEDFEKQMNALEGTRAYRKIALKAEALGRQLPEKFFFKNFGTRDLVDVSVSDSDAINDSLSNSISTSRLNVFLKALTKVLTEQPPPIKSSLIPDINLSARLLPSPILTSA
ncbi:hypothetical protein [Hydrogenophaga sp.]|jgi:hypothetical protein|uniref:hypothetical protein n=1 Tax=Hydrogenophaga sp. TaxID=1904254 RepID=UPI000BDA6907|nr:hypothetical protein [Hydrogenophaga sp.]MDP3885427.1 hypothetical protein [Hydrogenophaga sp.]OYZ39806.1 MAG: hypothetical protein B7Y16_08060 [Methylotenera sp. 24-45-7]